MRELAAGPGVVIVCGRFEGVDERVIEARGLEEVSIGDYVLSGGEIAAMVLLDACVRLLPGVMGKDASGAEESFEGDLLEYPHYTRPRDWEGRPIPEVLLSGNHAAIEPLAREEAERITRKDGRTCSTGRGPRAIGEGHPRGRRGARLARHRGGAQCADDRAGSGRKRLESLPASSRAIARR